jgi:diguanylate cyclase (GGDEF)-like protein
MFLLVLIRLVLQGRELREQDNIAHTRAMVRELRHRAYRDTLTGLGNRLLFQERTDRALSRAREVGGAASMLLIDLDNFKEVNDTQGHRAGDELLVAAAKRLAKAVRPGDLPVRLGGDEFAVLLADGSTTEAAETLAQRLVRVFGEPFRVSDAVVQVRASIGVASSDGAAIRALGEGPADSEEILFRNADLALYAAKEDGKGTWRAYEPYLYDAAVERLALRTSLDRAISREEFVLHYQPVIDLRGPTKVTSFEALVRWQNPDLGLLLPDQFIPLAEETGQIIPLGTWILGRAIADAARWNKGLPPGRRTRVAVNVSAHQFSGRGLADIVARCLAESGLPAQLLILEITETAFLHDQGGAVESNLNTLMELGVLIAIDDFGTGYSSIGYLRTLHFDLLKADKSFVDRIADPDEPQHATLLRGIVHVAETLGIAVVAEGVESVAQRDLLRAMGCAFAQGFLYSPAVPLDEVAALVAALEKESP